MVQSGLIKEIYLSAQKLHKLEESGLTKQLNLPKHAQHVTYKLFLKGTVKDKINAAKDMITDNPILSVYCLKDLISLIGTKLNKKSIEVIEGVALIFRTALKSTIPEIGNFADLLNQNKSLMKNLDENKEEDVTQLKALYTKSMLKIELDKLLIKIDALMKESTNTHMKRFVESLIDLLKCCPEYASINLMRSIVYHLGSNNNTTDLIIKHLTITINYKENLALRVVKLLEERMGIKNVSVDFKRNLISILVSVKFEELKNQEIKTRILNILLHQFESFLSLFVDKKTAKKKLLAEKKESVNFKKFRKRRYTLNELIKEKIEGNAKLLGQCIIGISKLMQHMKDDNTLIQFLEKNLKLFFNFCRLSSSKISIRFLIFMYSIVRKDLYSKVSERYANLLYDFINNPTIFESKLCEQIFDLLYNFIKNDFSSERKLAFVKRVMTTTLHCDSKIVVTTLIFLGKIMSDQIILQNLIHNKNKQVKEDDNEEVYKDVDDSSDELEIELEKEEDNEVTEKKEEKKSGFDFEKRNPLYANAQESYIWELMLLKKHYNPVVRKITNLLLNLKANEINYKGNPFTDFSYSSVFKRFALKDLKTVDSEKQHSSLKKRNFVENEQQIETEDGYDDENAMKMYFQNKINQLADSRRKKRKINTAEDDMDEDEFADKLFEEEMDRMAGDNLSDDFIDEEDDDEDISEDFSQDEGLDFDELGDEGEEEESDFRPIKQQKFKRKKVK